MWPNFLTLRNAAEQLQRLARIVDEAPAAEVAQLQMPSAVSLQVMPLRPENYKRADGVRDVSQIEYMVGHVTDVTGGFGVGKWGPDGWKAWKRRLYSGDVPLQILEDIRHEFGVLSDDELAKVLALCSRLTQLVYHRITSRKLGECINRPFEHRTWASTALNGGIALALDCGHREPIDDAFAEAGINMFMRAYYDLRDAGADKRILYVVHGQGSKWRGNDTHRIAHLRVYRPAVERLQAQGENIAIGYEVALGHGRPLTTRDDPDAHFDERGRRVRTPEGEPL